MMSTYSSSSDNDFDYDEDGVYVGTIMTLQADEVTSKSEWMTTIIIIINNSFKAQFQTAQCVMQLWNNTGAKILHAYMKAKYNRRKYL